jgi:hypothetical protein
VKRRDILKYFGIGTIIAPVAGEAIAAKLVEVPKVEIVKPEAGMFNPAKARVHMPVNLSVFEHCLGRNEYEGHLKVVEFRQDGSARVELELYAQVSHGSPLALIPIERLGGLTRIKL